jgi:hypothetical protein
MVQKEIQELKDTITRLELEQAVKPIKHFDAIIGLLDYAIENLQFADDLYHNEDAIERRMAELKGKV